MQKAVLQKITIIVLMLCLGTSKSLVAQDTLGFKWNLIEVLDPTIETKVVFTPLVPAPAKFTSWDFGDGTTSTTDSIATHSYLPTDTVSVSYNFSLNAKDSTITYKVFANTAAFSEQLDSNTNVTYTRILRSFFNFPVNDPTLLGNMRFEWTINGTILSDVSFPIAANEQFPNIRYTFENSGLNTVSLRAWNATTPANDVTFSRNINVQPSFVTKAKLNIPNVFTPNGDNVFDYFEVTTSGLSRLVLKVYTRTGALVYEKQATYIKWDGRNDNGKDLPEGIYYYIIEDLDSQYENAKGFVYIFRGK